MATLVPKDPRVQQKPNNLLKQLQSRTDFDVEQVLSSSTLVIDGPGARNWTVLLQVYWQILAKDFLNGSYQPTENPGGAGGDRVPTGLPSSGQDDDGEELIKLLQAFESVPSYVGRFADEREVW